MTDNIEILQGLSAVQRSAVECVNGPVLIVAGAGSGKTRVLTSRIAYLLDQGIEPSQILALTFTKKAAGEMKERIGQMVGERKARHLVMGTFHAVFVRFLREYAEFLGYPSQFTIYDTSDSQSAIRACIKELKLEEKQYKPKDVLGRISMAKNNLFTVAAYRANTEYQQQDLRNKLTRMADLYELYQTKLKQSGVMDFDDILLNMNLLLKSNPDALQDIASRFSHIMVDEYQDTNYSQYLIIKKLSQFHHNLCVVGDDSQSIYAFRGAKIENILKFSKDYPEYKIFRLERNYRSTKVIVDAANSVIAHNDGRIPKQCYSEAEDGDKILLIKAYTEQEEATSIVSEIMDRMRSDKAQYEDFAILYRTNAQSRALEEQLRRRNIPYMIYSGNSFFDRMEVKDMMAYFKLCVNMDDDEAFKRIVNKPTRGIGATTLASVIELAQKNHCSLMRASQEVPKLTPFRELIIKLAQDIKRTDAHEMAVRIAEQSGLYAFYKADTSIEGQTRVTNLDELLNSTAQFVEERQEEALSVADEEQQLNTAELIFTLDDYLENVSLLSNVDVSEDESTNNKVALMTVHSSKGLEFPYVFVAGMEENLFPSVSIMSSKSEVEEERRLFYVALTRARKALYLSFASTRMRNGRHESNSPSRFIKEIDVQYIANPLSRDEFASESSASWSGFGSRFVANSTRSYGSNGPGAASPNASKFGVGNSYGSSSRVKYEKKPATASSASVATDMLAKRNAALPSADPNFVPSPISQLRVGQRIEHNRFGKGTIESISGNGPEDKVNVRFDIHGLKNLILKYAKMRILP